MNSSSLVSTKVMLKSHPVVTIFSFCVNCQLSVLMAIQCHTASHSGHFPILSLSQKHVKLKNDRLEINCLITIA